MSTTLGRYGALTLAAALTVAACSKGENTATRTDTAAGAVAANTDTAHPAAAPHSDWSDAQILGFASAANIGEIEEGKLAEKKATNPAVKAFARQLRTDHQAMLDEGKSFGTKNNVVPDTTKDDVKDAVKDSHDEIKDLTDKKAGKDWDEDFIDKQIDGHKKTLDKLNDLEKSATNADLKAMLTKAAGKVQEHLTKAEDIKKNTLKS
ncbi:MAG: DUF4142 domain-containing protein [Gemmatimonadaceae bacterium]|nr:DUF4142 domain-containing protein [Gemmatimonadaceae bacterium]